jgi:Protein of unknown function (DUF3108)
MRHWLSAIALSCCASAQAAPPPRVELAYEVHYNGSAIADVSYTLEHDGKTYQLVERWKGRGVYALAGDAQRTSRGTIGAGGLRPLYYEDAHSRHETATARFDWDAKSLTLQFRHGPQQRPMPANAQDRLSFLFSFAFKPPANARVEFKIVDGKGIADYVFEIAGRERLKTPVGEIETLRLAQKTEKSGDRGREVWLDPARSYLPLRVLVVQKDGTRIEQVATRITPP